MSIYEVKPEDEYRTHTPIIRHESNPELEAGLAQFRRDHAYLSDHWEELVKQFPDQNVAVHRGQVVGTDTDAARLDEDLRSRGLPVEHVVIEYLATEDDILILPL
jgi:hypothetical protein